MDTATKQADRAQEAAVEAAWDLTDDALLAWTDTKPENEQQATNEANDVLRWALGLGVETTPQERRRDRAYVEADTAKRAADKANAEAERAQQRLSDALWVLRNVLPAKEERFSSRGPLPTPEEARKQAEGANRAAWEAEALADLRALPEPLLKSALAWLSDEALEADGRPRAE